MTEDRKKLEFAREFCPKCGEGAPYVDFQGSPGDGFFMLDCRRCHYKYLSKQKPLDEQK